MIRLKSKATLLFLCAFLAGSSAVSADTLRLNVGLWPGEREPELEQRMFLDDIVGGAPRFNLPWTNTTTTTIWPLGLQYFRPMGQGTLVFGLNYTNYSPEYAFNGIYLNNLNAVSIVNLEDYSSNDWDADIGYQFKLAGGKLLLTPRLGFRWNFQSFNYDELTIGNTIAISLDSPFDANARGTYFGLGGQFYLMSQISLVFDYMTTSVFPDMGGDMTFQRTVIGNNFLTYNDATAGYEMEINRWKLGVKYDISKSMGIEVGLQEESTRVTYPGYFDLPIVVVGGNANIGNLIVDEIITDIIFWEQGQTTKKGLVYFAFNYDINL